MFFPSTLRGSVRDTALLGFTWAALRTRLVGWQGLEKRMTSRFQFWRKLRTKRGAESCFVCSCCLKMRVFQHFEWFWSWIKALSFPCFPVGASHYLGSLAGTGCLFPCRSKNSQLRWNVWPSLSLSVGLYGRWLKSLTRPWSKEFAMEPAIAAPSEALPSSQLRLIVSLMDDFFALTDLSFQTKTFRE